MVNYLYRRMNREIKKIKYRAIGSSILIIISVMMYIGLASMIPIAGTALEEKVDDLELSDLMVHVNGANETGVDDLATIPGVASVEARLQVSTRVSYTKEGSEKEVASFLYGVDPARRPTINMLELKGGGNRYFSGNGSGTVLLERNFANQVGLDVGDRIAFTTGTGKVELEVIALVMSPEYIFMPVNPQSLMPFPGSLAVGWVPIDWLRGAFGLPPDFVNEFQFMFTDGMDETQMYDTINSRLSDDIILYSVPKDQVYGYALIKEDIKQGKDFTGLFALLFLMVAFFIVYISFARIVQEQRREIGVLRALGYSRGQVLGSYLYMALLIGFISSIIGVIGGLPLGSALGYEYVDMMLGEPLTAFVWDMESIALGLLFGPVTASIACLIAVWGTVRMDPQDAIRGAPSTFLKAWKWKAKASSRVGKAHKGPYINTYTFKNMYRHKARTVFTVMAVGASVMIGSMSLIMWASFENSLVKGIEDYENWDVLVEFTYPLNETTASDLVPSHATDTVFISRIAGDWHTDKKEGLAIIIGLEKDQRLHDFNIDEGRVARDRAEVMLNMRFGEDNGIGVGDIVHIRGVHGDIPLRVTGLVKDFIGTMFVDLDIIEQIAGTTVYSGMYVKASPGMVKDVKKEALTSPLVSEAKTRNDTSGGFLEFMSSYSSMMYIMSLLGVAVAAPTLANIVFVSVLERYPEYGQLRALGYSKGAIAKSILMELMVVVTMGSVIGAPFTYALIWSFEPVYQDFFPMYTTVIYPADWFGYMFMVSLVYLIAFLAAVPSIRHVNRMDIASTVSGGRFG